MKAIQIYRREGVFLTAFLLVSLLFSFSSCSGGPTYVGAGGGTSGSATYKVTVETSTNGGVAEGEKITLTVTPKTGYKLDALTVKDGGNNAVSTTEVTEGTSYTFKMPAGNVTVNATFKAMLGSKASPDAVGDIVFSDGSAVPYTADLTLTDEQKAAAIAVIFDATKKLGVGLKQGQDKMWAKSGTAGYNSISTLKAKLESGSNAGDAEFSGDGASDGSGSLETFKKFVKDNGNDYSEENYSAWYWIENYAAGLTGECASGWYMPSIRELCDLYNAKAAVNNSINKTGGTQMSTSNWYWSSSQVASGSNYAWFVSFGSGDLINDSEDDTLSVCAVRAF